MMGASTMMYAFLKPRIESQFIAHLVCEECALCMAYPFMSVQLVVQCAQ